MTFEDSGTGRELKKPIPEIREREGNGKNPFPKFGNGKGMKKSIPKIREREGNEKNPFPKVGNGKGMKKIHSRNSGRGTEASILGNDWEREFPPTPLSGCKVSKVRSKVDVAAGRIVVMAILSVQDHEDKNH